jgi:hypothetical protein
MLSNKEKLRSIRRPTAPAVVKEQVETKEPEAPPLTDDEMEAEIKKMLKSNDDMRVNWTQGMILLHVALAAGCAYLCAMQVMNPFKEDAAFLAPLSGIFESGDLCLELAMNAFSLLISCLGLLCKSRTAAYCSLIPGSVALIHWCSILPSGSLSYSTILWYSWIPLAAPATVAFDVFLGNVFIDSDRYIRSFRLKR